mgnify:FL=1
MPAANFDTVGVNKLDSLILYLSYNTESFTGDSLAPMQLSVYPLDKRLESPVYSGIDPAEYYNAQAAPVALTSYNASFLGLPDSLIEPRGDILSSFPNPLLSQTENRKIPLLRKKFKESLPIPKVKH